MDHVNVVVSEVEMPLLEDTACDEENTAAGSTKSPEKEGKMYVGKINLKLPPGF